MKVGARVLPASMRRINDLVSAAPKRVHGLLAKELHTWGQDWAGAVRGRMVGETGPRNLHRRTGFLENSINYAVSGSRLGTLKLRMVSAGVNYAGVQQFGGTIRPKNSRYLTIPTKAALTASGVNQVPSARAFIAAHPGETFFFRSKGGPRDVLLLMWKNPAAKFKGRARKFGLGGRFKGDAIAMFQLVSSVTIPGPRTGAPSRLGFFEEWNELKADRAAGLQRIARSAVGAA